MPTSGRWFVVGSFVLGCASAPPPPVAAPPRDLKAEKQLESVAADHEQVAAKLGAVGEHDRERCEFQVGDCKIEVKDQRDELMVKEQLTECRVMTDEAGVLRCMADGLVKHQKHAALAGFYSNDISCMQTVLACTEDLTRTAKDAAVMARAGQRERELRAVAHGAAAMNAMAAVDDEVSYLRATLPPSATDACAPDDVFEACTRAANSYEDQFEAELDKDDFHADVALGLLDQLAKARTSCGQPQLACLSTTLESHGLYPEGKKWVTRNFSALERREELGSALPAGARTRCINQASKEHQSRIVDAYVAYARESVLFFRVQLDKAFLAMHESQLACLESHAPRSSARAASR
jgi:hypothetical protein